MLPVKAGNLSLEDDSVVGKIYYFDHMSPIGTLLSPSKKLASMLSPIMDTSTESGHSQTILSPYPNFCKEEKIKSQSTLSKVLRKSKYIIQKYCH